MALPLAGARVVRGPDWLPSSNEDGGEGFVGTVVERQEVNADDGNAASAAANSSQASRVSVQWDVGTRGSYRCGVDGKYDLRIWDTAAAGICHAGVPCMECGQEEIAGILWQCRECPDSNLCSDCYAGNEHDIDHRFGAIAQPGAARYLASRRNGSICVMARGIFPGAKVVLCNHEGDSPDIGTVTKPPRDESGQRGMVEVAWPDGRRVPYRIGDASQADIKCVESARAGYYYRQHLPILGVLNNEEVQSMETIGRLVQIPEIMDTSVYSLLQEDVGSGISEISKMAFEIGEVKSVERSSGGVKVFFPVRGKTLVVHPAAYLEVQLFKVGDHVIYLMDTQTLKRMLRSLGSWTPAHELAIDRLGEVVDIRDDHSVLVQYGDTRLCMHPGGLVLESEADRERLCLAAERKAAEVSAAQPQTAQATKTNSADAATTGAASNSQTTSARQTNQQPGNPIDWTSMVTSFLDPRGEMNLNSEFVGSMFDLAEVVNPPSAMARAIIEEDLPKLEGLLQKYSKHVNDKMMGYDISCIQTAVDGGHVPMVELLVRYGCRLDIRDNDGDTALHNAAGKGLSHMVECLIRLGARVDEPGNGGCLPLHVACTEGNLTSARLLVREHKRSGVDIDSWSSSGFTPLHEAVTSDHPSLVKLLVDAGASMELASGQLDYNACQLASFKNSQRCLEIMLDKSPDMIHRRMGTSDGDTLLHIAAFFNSVETLIFLLGKPGCNLEAKDVLGGTALRSAVTSGAKACAEYLLAYGSALNAADVDGNSPLHVALYRQQRAEEGKEDELLESEETVSVLSPRIDKIQDGMEFITETGNRMAAIACFLAQQGSDLSYANSKGQTALQFAGSDKMRNAILQHYRPAGESSFHGSKRRHQSAASGNHSTTAAPTHQAANTTPTQVNVVQPAQTQPAPFHCSAHTVSQRGMEDIVEKSSITVLESDVMPLPTTVSGTSSPMPVPSTKNTSAAIALQSNPLGSQGSTASSESHHSSTAQLSRFSPQSSVPSVSFSSSPMISAVTATTATLLQPAMSPQSVLCMARNYSESPATASPCHTVSSSESPGQPGTNDARIFSDTDTTPVATKLPGSTEVQLTTKMVARGTPTKPLSSSQKVQQQKRKPGPSKKMAAVFRGRDWQQKSPAPPSSASKQLLQTPPSVNIEGKNALVESRTQQHQQSLQTISPSGSTTSSPSHQQNHRPEGEEHVPDTSTSKPVVSKPFTKATYNTSTVPAAENILPQTTENKQIGIPSDMVSVSSAFNSHSNGVAHASQSLEQVSDIFSKSRIPLLALCNAILEFDLAKTESLLRRHSQYVNVVDEKEKHSCMHTAVQVQMVSMVKLLHRYGGRLDVRSKIGDTPLHRAAEMDSGDMVTCLLELGAKLDDLGQSGTYAIHISSRHGGLAATKILIREHKKVGIDIDCLDWHGNTALHHAAAHNHHDVVKELLNAGASIVAVSGKNGHTPCQLAVIRDKTQALTAMLQHHPDLLQQEEHFQDGHITLLDTAAISNSVGCLTLLLQKMRCSLEARNSVGSTVLHAAISSGAKGSIEQLVAFGSKLDTEDEEGNSVLHGALYVQKRTQDQQDFALVDICHCQVSSSPLIDEIQEQMPFGNESCDRTAAIACFLAQQGCDLQYLNFKGQPAIEFASSDLMTELVMRFHQQPGTSTFPGSRSMQLQSSQHRSDQSPDQPTSGASPPRKQSLASAVKATDQTCSIRSCSNTAVVKFMPCGHTVTCARCSQQFNLCGVCRSIVEKRTLNGVELSSEEHHVQQSTMRTSNPSTSAFSIGQPSPNTATIFNDLSC